MRLLNLGACTYIIAPQSATFPLVLHASQVPASGSLLGPEGRRSRQSQRIYAAAFRPSNSWLHVFYETCDKGSPVHSHQWWTTGLQGKVFFPARGAVPGFFSRGCIHWRCLVGSNVVFQKDSKHTWRFPETLLEYRAEKGRNLKVVAVWLRTAHLGVGGSWQLADSMFARVDSHSDIGHARGQQVDAVRGRQIRCLNCVSHGFSIRDRRGPAHSPGTR